MKPAIHGTPSASFISAQSAVLGAQLNPEHTTTRYHFEYGVCPTLAGCASVHSTADESSAIYGQIPTTQEIVGLTPATTYAYRLVASNEFEENETTLGGGADRRRRDLHDQPAPTPQAETGAYTELTSTTATVTGTVDPDGLPASYTFELGAYEGANTQYATIFTGPAGTGTASTQETLPITGLQPGTTYAYRITVTSGYIDNETHTIQGSPVTFTTAGLPAVLTSPPATGLLAIPTIAFPPQRQGPLRPRPRP